MYLRAFLSAVFLFSSMNSPSCGGDEIDQLTRDSINTIVQHRTSRHGLDPLDGPWLFAASAQAVLALDVVDDPLEHFVTRSDTVDPWAKGQVRTNGRGRQAAEARG